MDEETTLEVAQRHVANGESLIAEQKAIIDRLRVDGHATGDAEGLLETLEETLKTMREHLEYEQARAKGAAP